MNKTKKKLLPLVAVGVTLGAIVAGCANKADDANSRRDEAKRLASASLGVLGDAAEKENALTCRVHLRDAQTGESLAADGFWGDLILSIARIDPWNNLFFGGIDELPKLSEIFLPDDYGRSYGGFYRTVAKSSFPTNAPRFDVEVVLVIPKHAEDKEQKPETTAEDVLPKILEAMAEEEVNPMEDVLEFLRNRKRAEP
ncbi:MAG: hypothetical protein ILM98_14255 [Kiritimatiellae bacterium]|nr:hypothetical protein [Kiritimatiellia bacterium]